MIIRSVSDGRPGLTALRVRIMDAEVNGGRATRVRDWSRCEVGMGEMRRLRYLPSSQLAKKLGLMITYGDTQTHICNKGQNRRR